jgi:hypothetical protein
MRVGDEDRPRLERAGPRVEHGGVGAEAVGLLVPVADERPDLAFAVELVGEQDAVAVGFGGRGCRRRGRPLRRGEPREQEEPEHHHGMGSHGTSHGRRIGNVEAGVEW